MVQNPEEVIIDYYQIFLSQTVIVTLRGVMTKFHILSYVTGWMITIALMMKSQDLQIERTSSIQVIYCKLRSYILVSTGK